MRKFYRYLLGVLTLGVVITAGIFAPEYIARAADKGLLDKPETESLGPEQGTVYPDISMLNKLTLAGAFEYDQMRVPLKTGSKLDCASAREAFYVSCAALAESGLLPVLDMEEAGIALSIEAALHVSPHNPAVNAVLWTVELKGKAVSGMFLMDDETGKILRVSLRAQQAGASYTEEAAAAWAAYLGLELEQSTIATDFAAGKDEKGILVYHELYHLDLASGGASARFRCYAADGQYYFSCVAESVTTRASVG